MARRWAKEKEKELLVFSADWDKYGKAAGPLRNLEIVRNADFIIAFPSLPKGRGTQNSIELARKHGVKILKIENV